MRWVVPHYFPTLDKNQVHIWKIDLQVNEKIFSTLQEVLSSEEQVRASKLRTEAARRFIVARARLRELLGLYLGQHPTALKLNYTKNGKPYLDEMLFFNISHSENLGLLAFSWKSLIGIDIEYKKLDIEFKKIAERFFTSQEYQELLSLPEGGQFSAFYLCWVKKEALTKALGLKLYDVLGHVSLKHITSPISLISRDDNNISKDFQLIQLPVNDNYAAAIAVETHLNDINCFNFSETFTPC